MLLAKYAPSVSLEMFKARLAEALRSPRQPSRSELPGWTTSPEVPPNPPNAGTPSSIFYFLTISIRESRPALPQGFLTVLNERRRKANILPKATASRL